MEEQVQEIANRPRARKLIPALLVALLLIIGVSAYVAVSQLRPPDPASLIPQDATFAVMIDATPTSDKMAAEKYFGNLLEKAGIKLEETDMADLGKSLGIDVERDVLSHVNGVAAFAVLTEMAGITPETAGAVGIRTNREAENLIPVIEKSLKKQGIPYNKTQCSGIECLKIHTKNPASAVPAIYDGSEAYLYVGAVKRSITFANCQDAFKKMVDVANGKPSLLAEKNYTRLRKKGPATIATTYYSGGNLYKLVGNTLQLACSMAAPQAADSIKAGIETNIASVCTVEANADKLTFTTRGITKDTGINAKNCDVNTLISGAPKEAALVVSLGNFAELWSQYRKQIEKNPIAKEQMDKIFTQARDGIGLDLNSEFLDRVISLQFCYTSKIPKKQSAFPGALSAVLKVDKPEVVGDSVQKLHLVMAMMGGINVQPTVIAGQSGFIAPVDKNGSVLTDVRAGDRLIISYGDRDAARGAISSLKASSADPAKTSDFGLVKKYLPAQGQFLVFGDLEKVADAFYSGLDQKERKKISVIAHGISKFGVVGTSTPTSYTLLTVIPFTK